MHTAHHVLRRAPLILLISAVVAALAGGSTAYADLLYALSSSSSQFETTQVGTTFPENISVRAVLLSNFSNGVPNLPVVFTAPASGASGTFSTTHTNTVTVITSSTGFATAPA